MKKFEIINSALVVTDTVSGEVLLDFPKRDVYYRLDDLKLGNIQLIDVSADGLARGVFACSLSVAVDSLNASFTEADFQSFCRLNLGFNSASLSETDPIFGVSEAALFVSGDKAKLDALDGGTITTVSATPSNYLPPKGAYIEDLNVVGASIGDKCYLSTNISAFSNVIADCFVVAPDKLRVLVENYSDISVTLPQLDWIVLI